MADPSPTSKTSRRSFLSTAGTAGVAAAIAGCEMNNKASPESARTAKAPGTSSVSPPAASPAAPGTVALTLRVNGLERQVNVDPRATLLDTLRESLDLPGTKKGCDHGQCGACTVHVNGRRVNSCLTLALAVQGDDITTIEGIGTPESLHPMQAAFVACDGYQCGYCTSGQIMSAIALLKEPCGPNDADVKELMSGNICRCGAYPNIVAAIQQVRGNA
jgi:xanthine dehydrogenase YagT iron-sulfur-binding subunit